MSASTRIRVAEYSKIVDHMAANGTGGLGTHAFPYDADHEIWIDGQAVCVK